jgi:hypothetical protein
MVCVKGGVAKAVYLEKGESVKGYLLPVRI